MSSERTEAASRLVGVRAVVLGLGRFGGGLGAARYLAERGASVVVTDREEADRLQASVAKLADLPGVTLRLGGHDETDFRRAELVVVNPAVKPDHPMLAVAREAGARVTTEIGLLIERLPDRRRVIGVTGTAGKSTVSAMIAHALTRATPDPVRLGGNLGGSLLPVVDDLGPADRVVLELSSFMLHYLRPMAWSPGVAVVTNFAPNHLDWHGSLAAYRDEKAELLAHQRESEGDAAVLGPGVRSGFDAKVSRVVDVGVDAGDQSGVELLVPGRHNRVNAQLAAAALEAATGIDRAAALDALGDFPGLPHRLQLVVEHHGVRFFNDSKATTPDAAMQAIESFEPGTVHAILGGYDKGSDLTPLARHAAARCAAIYTLGQTGEAIAEAARAAPASAARVTRCDSLEAAVAAAVEAARAGTVVLLSPGCASWGMFEDYERRGEAFTESVLRWATETGA